MVMNQRIGKLEQATRDLDRLFVKGVVSNHDLTSNLYSVEVAGYGDTYKLIDVLYYPIVRSILVKGETDSAVGHTHNINFSVDMPIPVVNNEVIVIKLKKGTPDTWAILGVINATVSV